MKPTCIDLKARYGRRYRVTFEECHEAEYGPGARTPDPWLMILPAKYGHIFPHGDNELAASVDGYPKIAARLRRLPCCRVHQDGDDGELTVVFDAADFPQVARILRPSRRRQLSQEQRERLRAMGFKKGHQSHVHVQHSGRACVPEAQPDPEHLSAQRRLFEP